jgi:Holliday junction resolvase-like predicted endonuclease
MVDKKELGRIGEGIACDTLVNKGYKILEEIIFSILKK